MNDLADFNRKIRADLTIQTTQRDHPLTLTTTWGLFSPRVVDEGSAMLLKYLEINPEDNCLDLGCGYGVLGLNMAQCAPGGQTLLVDKDFVAVDYAEKNRKLNHIGNAECLLSNGFDQATI